MHGDALYGVTRLLQLFMNGNTTSFRLRSFFIICSDRRLARFRHLFRLSVWSRIRNGIGLLRCWVIVFGERILERRLCRRCPSGSRGRS